MAIVAGVAFPDHGTLVFLPTPVPRRIGEVVWPRKAPDDVGGRISRDPERARNQAASAIIFATSRVRTE